MLVKPESIRIKDLIDFKDPALTAGERHSKRAAWKVLCRASDNIALRMQITEPTLEDFLKYEIIVHSNDSVHLSHTESPRSSIYDSIGVPTLKTIQDALQARIGRKLNIIDMRSTLRKRRPLTL